MIGQTISHYKITGKLGEGGMGEVYRAEDTTLKREVAIKVLPERFTQDTERLARFQREAQVLASLNHPNIAAIHSFEHSDGVHFLAMELVEGETLAERVAKGPLPVEEALEVSRQIAEGLEAAHESGIIHRDLKPANVKITPEGKVKVLDFGLAKALEGETAAADISHSPTRTDEMTSAGVILGTAGYMSPEQARGQAVDKRTDIWSFGCVLYEALTSRQVFGGETMTDILGAIVHKEPDWDLVPAEASSLRRILARCLAKEPRQRYHHIADVRIALEESLAYPPASEVEQLGADRAELSGGRKVFFGTALLTTTLLASLVTWMLIPDEIPQIVHSSVLAPEGAAFDSTEGSFALSPDGRFLAFVARRAGEDRALWVRPLESEYGQRLQGTENAHGPFWSPDSRFIGFFADGKLKKIAASGRPIEIMDSVQRVQQGTWNQDGVILFATNEGRAIHRLGSSRTVTALGRDETSHGWPRFLPDGNHFLYDASSIAPEHDGKIYVSSLDGMKPKFLADGRNASYADPGYLLSSESLWILAMRATTVTFGFTSSRGRYRLALPLPRKMTPSPFGLRTTS